MANRSMQMFHYPSIFYLEKMRNRRVTRTGTTDHSVTTPLPLPGLAPAPAGGGRGPGGPAADVRAGLAGRRVGAQHGA